MAVIEMSGQHPYFDPSFQARSQQERDAQQAAQDAARTLGQDLVSQRLNQEYGASAQQEAAQRALGEAAYVRDQQARRMMWPVQPQPDTTRIATSSQPVAAPVPPTPEELERQAAENQRLDTLRARNEARACEEARRLSVRRRNNRMIEGICTIFLIVGFIPTFIATFGSGSAFNPVFGIIYGAILVVFFVVKSP